VWRGARGKLWMRWASGSGRLTDSGGASRSVGLILSRRPVLKQTTAFREPGRAVQMSQLWNFRTVYWRGQGRRPHSGLHAGRRLGRVSGTAKDSVFRIRLSKDWPGCEGDDLDRSADQVCGSLPALRCSGF
jgi:hypothetical protein